MTVCRSMQVMNANGENLPQRNGEREPTLQKKVAEPATKIVNAVGKSLNAVGKSLAGRTR